MYPVIPESDRPSDLADDCILSPGGVNPVSKNDEVPSFLQLPRGIGNTADTD